MARMEMSEQFIVAIQSMRLKAIARSFIASNKLEDDKFISYAPAKSVMVVPFLSSAGSIHGCIECSSVEIFSEFDIGTAKLLALHISMF